MGVYQNYTRLVDDGAIGIRNRKTKKEGTYYLHPLVRSGWGTVDPLRGAQGYYYAKGSYKGEARLFNFSRHPWWSKNIRRPLVLAGDGRFTNSSFTVYFDNENWNLATKSNKAKLNNYLSQPTTDAITGDPNFYQYLGGNIGETAYYKRYYEKRRNTAVSVPPVVQLDKEFTDHVTLYRMPPTDRVAMAKSNYNLAVNPFYNFYLDTMPPYETVVSFAGRGVELLLPNLYMLESDIQNTASVNYTDQLTLNKAGDFYDGPQLDVWFLEQNQTSPESGKAYFQQFSEALNTVNTNGAIEEIKEEFESRFKNVAILYPDLEILKKYNIRDDRGTPNDTSDDIKATAFYPFYNEIIIGFDRDDVVGPPTQRNMQSFFTSLFASKLDADHVRSFIVFMQLYIIENIRLNRVQPSSYQGFTRKTINAAGATSTEVTSMNQQSETVLDLDLFLEALKSRELDYLLDVYNQSKEEMAEDSNYTILREWEKEELFKLNIKDAIKVANSRELEDALDERRRTLKEVFGNLDAPGETLMYLIEKREDIAGRETPAPVIQTIMVSKDVVYSELIRYIDTQVRYGVRYQYDVKQVRMIFGNSYTYDGISFDFGTKKIGQGKAVGNALGFYNPTDQTGIPVTVDGLDPGKEYRYLRPAEEQDPAAIQQGHFVFKLPAATANRLVAKKQLPASRASAAKSPLGQYYRAIRAGKVDLSGLIVEIHDGYGTEGSRDGGMTALDIQIPVLESAAGPDLSQPHEEVSDTQNPLPLYHRAINILVGEIPGGQGSLDSTINDIASKFENIIEDGNRAKVNGLLGEMRRSRDTMMTTAEGTAGASSVSVTDERSLAARSIYNAVDTKVRELLVSVDPVSPESEDVDLTNPLLKEILGPATPPERTNTATTFTGGKGQIGMNMQFGKG